MAVINKSAPVMVTGATGYVAGQLVKKLLEEGLVVHAPVRDHQNPEKLKYLNALAEKSGGDIRFFKADLLSEGSYAEAMEGCELVFHTASPFKVEVKDPQEELVDPAMLGTRNVLEQASKTASVKRVVLTSSCAAIYGDNTDVAQTANGMLTEEHWNESASIEHNAYSYSKTVAEKEAWKLHDAQSRWDLVVINPSLVIGPGINPFATSESFTMVKQYGDGTLKVGAPRWGFGAVDVRDLAIAHYQAGFTPTAKGRHIISGHNTDLFDLAATLLDKYGEDYPIPRRQIPKWLLWLVGPLANRAMTRKMIARNAGIAWIADNSKGVRELGVSYRPLKESMEDFFQQLIDHGLLKAK